MSTVVEMSQTQLAINVFGKNDITLITQDDEELSDSNTKKTETGTQTKISRSKVRTLTGPPQKCLNRRIIPNYKPRKRKVKLMDWKKYHRLSVINSFINELEKDYPAICTVTVIGTSVEGRDIKVKPAKWGQVPYP